MSIIRYLNDYKTIAGAAEFRLVVIVLQHQHYQHSSGVGRMGSEVGGVQPFRVEIKHPLTIAKATVDA